MIDWLSRNLGRTAWPQTPAAPYGPFHLPFLIIGLAVVIVAAALLRNRQPRTIRRLLFGLGVFLALLEIYKALMFALVLEGPGYELRYLPLQICSVPVYLLLIVPWLKSPPARQAGYDFLFTYSLISGLAALLWPNNIIWSTLTITIMSFVWHLALVFSGLLLGLTGLAARRLSHFRPVLILFLCLAAVAVLVGALLHPIADVDLFFINPYLQNGLPIVGWIQSRFGWIVSTAAFLGAYSLAAYALLAVVRSRRKASAPDNRTDDGTGAEV